MIPPEPLVVMAKPVRQTALIRSSNKKRSRSRKRWGGFAFLFLMGSALAGAFVYVHYKSDATSGIAGNDPQRWALKETPPKAGPTKAEGGNWITGTIPPADGTEQPAMKTGLTDADIVRLRRSEDTVTAFQAAFAGALRQISDRKVASRSSALLTGLSPAFVDKNLDTIYLHARETDVARLYAASPAYRQMGPDINAPKDDAYERALQRLLEEIGTNGLRTSVPPSKSPMGQ